MKSSNEMKKDPDKNTGKVIDEKKSTLLKNGQKENKTTKPIPPTKDEKEAKKSISRWDTDGGVELNP